MPKPLLHPLRYPLDYLAESLIRVEGHPLDTLGNAGPDALRPLAAELRDLGRRLIALGNAIEAEAEARAASPLPARLAALRATLGGPADVPAELLVERAADWLYSDPGRAAELLGQLERARARAQGRALTLAEGLGLAEDAQGAG